MTLADSKIRELCNPPEFLADSHKPMITPFVGKKTKDMGPSYGLSSAGYDCRLAGEFWIGKPGYEMIDTADLGAVSNSEMFDHIIADDLICMPGMFVLGRTIEYFAIPRTIIGKCIGKSSLRRIGLVTDMTPLEPGWEGNLVLEFNFTFPRPVRIHAGMGVCQILFDRVEGYVESDYAEAGGKYHGQTGITPAR